LAEWVREHQEIARGTASGALNNSAGHVTASVAIGGDVTYEGVKPHHAVDLSHGYWGALEIGARFNWLQIDAADPTKSVSKAEGYGLALNWQLSRNLKASGNFEETWFNAGKAGSADRNTEKVLIGRFQVAF
jgi:phosphate-selective porin